MKHLFSICIVALMIIVFQACGNKTNKENEEIEISMDSSVDSDVNNDNDYYYDDNNDEDVDEEDSHSKSSTNWNQILDEYDSYVDKYVSLVKKANKGDVSAMNEYVDMLEKAQNLADKLEGADDEMSSAQIARYTRITKKMTQAAIDGTNSSYKSTKKSISDWDIDDDDFDF
ncbi:MAG: hypothetical protein J6Y47_07430 [Bacteroidales bacterium]|nr:hypothetical protein [Bacteroidales bacterium]